MKRDDNTSKKSKTPWPTKDAMEQVYDMNLWGDHDTRFYSGDGSHHVDIVAPYVETVRLFLSSFKTPLSVCDLGCGDFNVGKELVSYTKKYIAVDIVSDLIDYNKSHFKVNHLEFQCLDIALDDLPEGDCVLIRQVLQHISNEEVQKTLNKLSKYKYVILTEHLPNDDFIPNKDIISGQGIRIKKKSGLNILKPPFNFKVKAEKELVSTILKDKKGVIKTTLYTVF